MTKKKRTPNAEFRDWDLVPAEEFLPPQKESTHIMAERENILTVAQLHLPDGMTRHEYALQLMKLNTSFAVGRIINLV
jgi:hypothetical protein